jgi:polysaccharide export outer membrane protein
VRCLQTPEFGEQSYRIDDDGEITLPLLGRIKAAGFSIREFELELTRRLGESIRAPQVAVVMVNYRSQPMSVIGEVTTPGLHQLEGRKTLIEVLSLGGGLRTTAGPTVRITRRVEYGTIPLPGAAPDRTGTFYVANVELRKVLGGDPISNIAQHRGSQKGQDSA